MEKIKRIEKTIGRLKITKFEFRVDSGSFVTPVISLFVKPSDEHEEQIEGD